MQRLIERAKELLSGNKDVMERIAAFLIEKETISGKEFMELFYELRPEAKAEAERKKAEKEAQKDDATAAVDKSEYSGEIEAVNDAEIVISAEAVMESDGSEEKHSEESDS